MIYDVGRSLIHHGFNRLIFVNGHGSNVKVIDPVLRKLRNETGALIAYYKPYAERYIGMLKDVLEGPVEETPGWHAGELKLRSASRTTPTSCGWIARWSTRRIARNGSAKPGRKKMACPTPNFRATSTSISRLNTRNLTDLGVMGNPQLRGTAESANAFSRFSQHLDRRGRRTGKVDVQVKNRDFTEGKSWGW